jgi:hypothetical protein
MGELALREEGKQQRGGCPQIHQKIVITRMADRNAGEGPTQFALSSALVKARSEFKANRVQRPVRIYTDLLLMPCRQTFAGTVHG